MWQKSGLQWTEFLSDADKVDEFLAKHVSSPQWLLLDIVMYYDDDDDDGGGGSGGESPCKGAHRFTSQWS